MKLLLSSLLALLPSIALGHDAPMGWSYPLSCCSNRDCKPLAAGEIRETPMGYEITSTGEIVGYADRRVKPSPDGSYHVCQQGGDFDKGRALCVFAPPMGF
jgi:hypothetical protein